MQEIRVLKFGGTSVANAKAMKQVARIVSRFSSSVVVLSATSGTTNQLVELIRLASSNRLDSAFQLINALNNKHLQLVESLGIASDSGLMEEVGKRIDHLKSMIKGIFYLGEVTPKAYDSILSTGELLSTTIFSAYFKHVKPCRLVDARDFLITDNTHQKASPLIEPLEKNVNNLLKPLLNQNITVITQGFIGKSETGETTTLGRGGSDFTASLIGMALNASQIEIWTDVSGVYTADPRMVPNARPVQFLTFDEASELAYFGARVLHPSTIIPAMQKHIPVLVKNTHHPEETGTQITQNGIQEGRVQAIAFKKDVIMVTIESTRMLMAYGFLEKLFRVFSQYETAVDLISTSEISVSLTIDDSTHLPEIIAELESFSHVTVRHKMGMIAIVGNKIRERKGFLNETFSIIRHLSVEMVSFGGSNINLSLIVNGQHLAEAVQLLHSHFFEGGSHG